MEEGVSVVLFNHFRFNNLVVGVAGRRWASMLGGMDGFIMRGCSRRGAGY